MGACIGSSFAAFSETKQAIIASFAGFSGFSGQGQKQLTQISPAIGEILFLIIR
jgi:hypothetical protein